MEDEARMARLLQRGLTEEGHHVDVCSSGRQALLQAQAVAYDVVLLDWSLPELDGLSVLRQWREAGLQVPVLMLTARGSTGEKVLGLRAGADDYLVKPFDFDELLARLEALTRRSSGQLEQFQFHGLRLDPQRRMLVCGAHSAELTAREFALVRELFAHPHEVLARSRLLNAVWGSDFDGAPNVVDVYIGYLRAKFTQVQAAGVEIASVRGVGYRLTQVASS